MLKIEFTPEEIDALEYERYHHPDPKVQKKTGLWPFRLSNRLLPAGKTGQFSELGAFRCNRTTRGY